MINTDALREAINKSGRSMNYVAEALKISRGALYDKMTGSTEFKASEISTLYKLLDLELDDISRIFFNRKVN